MIDGVTTYGSDELTKKLQECEDPVFLLTIGTTETSLIPGLSGAGPSADLTEYTPASDVEFMVLGEVRCCDAPAETVVGDAAAPTPARLTKAALQLAKRGIETDLYEMRPIVETGAHKTDKFAEFVCSNSLGSYDITNASGLLKHEMEILGSELMKIIKETKVPAGGALAVDRELFSSMVTEKIIKNPLINIKREEVKNLNFETPIIIASGPLTSESLSSAIKEYIGEDYFYFFDAIAPIVEKNSINFEKAFYLNPITKR